MSNAAICCRAFAANRVAVERAAPRVKRCCWPRIRLSATRVVEHESARVAVLGNVREAGVAARRARDACVTSRPSSRIGPDRAPAQGRRSPRSAPSGRCPRRRRCRGSRPARRRSVTPSHRARADARRRRRGRGPRAAAWRRSGDFLPVAAVRRAAPLARRRTPSRGARRGPPSPARSRPDVVFAVRSRSTVSPCRITVTESRDRHHLVELVRDEHDRLAARAHRAQHGPQLVDLGRREHRGRLVEDRASRAAVERLEDLHALRLADRELGDDALRRPRRSPVVALSSVDLALGARAIEPPRRSCGSRPSTTFSATVSVGTSMKCWCTMPTPAAIASAVVQPVTSRAVRLPCGRHRARTSRSSTRISVDLPAPFSPTSAWISPRATSSDAPRFASTAPKRLVDVGEPNGGSRRRLRHAHLVLGTAIRPAMISRLSASTRARTLSGMSARLCSS